ncbi:MAG: DUF948 domain-containing protein [Endomicrobiia bacterium]
MKVFIIFSILIFLAGFIILVVYSVYTLIQIKKTAKEAEFVLQKINKNLENVTNISNEFKKVVSSFVPIILSFTAALSSGLIKFLKGLFFRR